MRLAPEVFRDAVRVSGWTVVTPGLLMVLWTCTVGWQRDIEFIDAENERMVDLVREWASIPSGSFDLEGLSRVTERIAGSFRPFGAEMDLRDLSPTEKIDLPTGELVSQPLGRALHVVRRRDETSLRVFLGCHLDTVFGRESSFDSVTDDGPGLLRGPGVADAKGGIVVLLVALEALERSAVADRVSWEVLLNPDEEIGSPGSSPLLEEAARRNDVGLVFEPSLPDGALIDRRKGSGNFTLVVRGRSAHAGRAFAEGRNAVTRLARAVGDLDRLNGLSEDLTVNVARVEGGGAPNVVPDLAVCRFNVRYGRDDDRSQVERTITAIVDDIRQQEGFTADVHGGFSAPPKEPGEAGRRLLDHVVACGRDLGLDLETRRSGGVCDGNRLAAAGLPNVDTLGPRGDGIHSNDERLIVPSLTERARLAARVLLGLADNVDAWRRRLPCS